jgi:hypothetical protein
MKGNVNDKRKWFIRIEIESIAYGRRMTNRVSWRLAELQNLISGFDNFQKYRLADNSNL